MIRRVATQALRRFARNEEGVAAVEAALLSGLFVVLIGGGVELGLAFHQHNASLQSARTGARLAATSAPIANELTTMTGMGGGLQAGDPLPAYDITCSGATRRCSQGSYNHAAMGELVFGPDGVGCNETDNRAAQGMCDFIKMDASNVSVRYQSSGLGTAGNPADPVPIITVTISDLTRDYVFLERLLPGTQTLKTVSVTVMAEDLRGA
jgi:Flp pilus assembly pilin Flp